MRILHILDHSVPLQSGYSFRTLSILREQRALGWETFHLTGPKQGECPAAEEDVDGWRFARTSPSRGPCGRWPVVGEIGLMARVEERLEALALRLRPDVLHAHSPLLNALPALRVGRRLGIPVVYEVRAFWEDAAVDHGTTREGSVRYRATRALETRVLDRCDAITTICEGLRRDIVARGIDLGKVTVIPNAVDLAEFPAGIAADVALARSLGLEGAFVVGFAGSFYAYEGLDLLLAAFPAVLAAQPQARLLLVGGGPQAATLERQARALGVADKVVFAGRVPHADVTRYYGLFDLLAYPRHSMRLTELVTPLKPLEAMALGKPVLASDVGGHRELIRAGETGLLFRAGDAVDLAGKIVAASRDVAARARLGEAGRRFVADERTWKTSVARYAEVYRRAALPRVVLVGPLPPPPGGMANQTEQLATLLRGEAMDVRVVPTNAPYRPAAIAAIPAVRAAFRLVPYLVRLWRAAGRAQVFHVMANSGWSWHLFAAPAVWIARARGVRTIVNYRGGDAEAFFAHAFIRVRPTLEAADLVVVPSGFLAKLFAHRGIATSMIPNIVDLERFAGTASPPQSHPHLVVTRHLEAIYDVATALRAFARVRNIYPHARLTVAGEGPERSSLEALAVELGVRAAVEFVGRLDRDAVATLNRSASVSLNASRVDNMPNAVLEALAAGVPVVSTAVGGVPHLVTDGQSALLVAAGDDRAMADAIMRVLGDPDLAARLARGGREVAHRCSWPVVRALWMSAYQALGWRPAMPARGAYTRWTAAFLFPLHERLKGHATVAVHRRLERTQWWPRARLEALQLAGLRALVASACEQVPYYQELFKARGVTAQSIGSLGDLATLPFLAKPDVRAHRQAMRARGAVGLTAVTTGGSSGEPLAFDVGRERVSHDVAARWRAMRWWGVDVGDREVVVWGSPIELGAQDGLRALRDRLLRTRLLSAFEMSASNLDRMVGEIQRVRPRIVFGYPSALAHIARHAQLRGQRLDDLGVRVAMVTAEMLHDGQRRAIERAFGCAVADGYGGRDAGFVAHECPQGRLHVSEDIVLEIVSPEGRVLSDGTAGEIVVTHLATAAFPFIRYRTGDLGVLSSSDCPCGRGLRVLQEIRGRSTDLVVAQDGTVVHGLALIYVLREVPGLEAFKVVQQTRDRVEVQIVEGAGYAPESTRRIAEGIRARLGAGVEVAVESVARIAPEASGKHRYVQSRVTQ